ncbi:type 2C protein phosphatase [Saccharomycopsis crataegensis]|uniref:protein-serine/threonine phosphatase n=1 Tax=Saccharomycopsis crataegensis TaxID=43959 RepID=A0AAV5QN60_9ASCO|nr:type 2C protein phosphatase [Saccharomycopsis crataegensis]
MGQFLSQPVTEKHSEDGGDEFLKFGLSSMQGWRVSMEDSHSTILDLNKVKSYKQIAQGIYDSVTVTANDDDDDDTEADKESTDCAPTPKDVDTSVTTEIQFDEQVSFFAVFDGHGGSRVALFSGEHLPQILRDHSELIQKKQYAKALQDSFLACDRAILDDPAMKNDSSGCAATSILCTPSKLVCANSGDSRIVLSIDGQAKAMSYDHKPSNEGEKARIVAAGGFVDVGRVNGNLALSRCIGDFDFKKSPNLPPEEQIVTAFPDIIEHTLDYAHDEFIILACDGIWDCLTSQQCVELVRRGIHERLSLTEISEKIIDVCVAPNSMGTGIGCDNMSIIVVAILDGKSLDQWYDDIIAKEGTPISEPFNEIRKQIFKTELGPNEHLQQDMQATGEEAFEEETPGLGDTGITQSLSQLLSSSVATFQDGTYYIDTSNSSSILASLGILPGSEFADAEGHEMDREIDEEDDEDEEEEESSKVEEIEVAEEKK